MKLVAKINKIRSKITPKSMGRNSLNGKFTPTKAKKEKILLKVGKEYSRAITRLSDI